MLFCLKIREKGKKKKARYGVVRTAHETLELARSYYKILELILPKITPETAVTQPKLLGWFLQTVQLA